MTKLYPLIIADPPWMYYGSKDKPQAAGKHYDLMTLEELNDLFWPLDHPGILFLWATCPKLDVCMDLGRKLGLTFRGVPFVWVKTKKDGTPIGAAGVRASIVKPLTEFVLAFSNIPKGRPLFLRSEGEVQTIFSPVRKHSQKPVKVMESIERMYGIGTPKLEMFARERRKGWDAWGNQI